MKRVLFLCTHNSVRSQMAEGWTRYLFPGQYEVYSAGTEPTSVHPLAIQVMKEVGIDISRQKSKSLQQYVSTQFDLVITLCDSAKESCPVFLGSKRTENHSFTDPTTSGQSDQHTAFRLVRDQIKSFVILELPQFIQ